VKDLVIKQESGDLVTTSLAIAEGVGATHKVVIELIRKNINRLENSGRVTFKTQPFETAGGNQTRKVAILTERQALLLLTMMRNNDVVLDFKETLINVFFEMREQLSNQLDIDNIDPEVFVGMIMKEVNRRKLIAEEKKVLEHQNEVLCLEKQSVREDNERLAHKVEEDAPRVEFAKKVEASEDYISVGHAAKLLGTGRNRLYAFLRQIRWVTRKNEPYQNIIEQGYLNVKISKWHHPEDGLQESLTTVVSGKGLAKLQELWNAKPKNRVSQRHETRATA